MVTNVLPLFYGSQCIYIHLYSPHNMTVQANETGTSKNTTNKKVMTVPLYTHITFNSQYPLQVLNHLA